MKTEEEKKAWQREYYRKNRKRIRAYGREYWKRNRERLNAQRRARYYYDEEFRRYDIARHKGKPLTAEVRPASPADKQNDIRKGKSNAL